jgi:dTDP-4-amino-4,6-dideoxygalactose transaminase
MTEDVADEIDLAWKRVTSTSSFIGGELVENFEREWSTYCGVANAIGVANGTDAIELTLRALGIGPGDEVIVPTNTFIATAEGVVFAGATPRFVDVDPETLLATPETISAAVNHRTAAIILVHLYGNMSRVDEIGDLAAARSLAFIEDAAQAHGSTWNGRTAGSFGVAGSFSFYPGKNLGAFGDAGAVVTDDDTLAARVRSLANHGRTHGSNYVHDLIGKNSRLDSLQAAVLSAKLRMLDQWNDDRRAAMASYRWLLRDDANRLVKTSQGSTHHQNVVRVPDRDRLQASLRESGIETGIHYPIPCHEQEPYRRFAVEPLPEAERAAQEVLSLPLFPHMSEQQIAYVCRSFRALLAQADAHVG